MKSISKVQSKVLKVLKDGGEIRVMPYKRHRYRLVDNAKNPISFVHGRTFNALVRKEIIKEISNGYFASV